MNWHREKRVSTGARGAALLAALCFTLVLAIALSSYVMVCHRTLQMSTRDVSAGHTIELAETGMEEALWALQAAVNPGAPWSVGDWMSNGWSIGGMTATKTLSGFSYDNNSTGSASLTINNYNGGTRTVTVVGTVTQSDGTTMSRTLTSRASQAPLFVNAIAATTDKIIFKVAGTVDSYDSSINVSPTPGQTGYSAIVCSGCDSTISSTVQLLNAQIQGYVAMLPSSPSNLFYSSSARIVGPNTAIGVNIDTARISTSPYQPIFDEVTPSAVTPVPSFSASDSTNTIGTPGAVSPSYYYATDLGLTGSQTLRIDGPVVLVVSGSLTIDTSASIVVTTSANASLEVHVGRGLTIDGNGIDNQSRYPRKLAILATASSASQDWEMGTNATFYGVIYAPSNSLTISNAQTIYGAIVAKSVTFNQSPTFHYDMNLRQVNFAGLSTPFAVTTVRETGG